MLQKSLIRRLDLITLQLFVAVHEEGTLNRTRAAARCWLRCGSRVS
jgi:hypothetical protein